MGRNAKIAPTKKEKAPKKGSPLHSEKNKAGGDREVNDLEHLDEHFDASEEFTNEGPDEIGNNVKVNNPNRGHDKPDLNKPSYK
ncbi:hypothetical protein RCC89_00330 [Cytophagaceae bacterium ABcell3]|nr:hypothetical protein RCC89_00330 [Cytophagaceae bacterium ABcell3]